MQLKERQVTAINKIIVSYKMLLKSSMKTNDMMLCFYKGSLIKFHRYFSFLHKNKGKNTLLS